MLLQTEIVVHRGTDAHIEPVDGVLGAASPRLSEHPQSNVFCFCFCICFSPAAPDDELSGSAAPDEVTIGVGL